MSNRDLSLDSDVAFVRRAAATPRLKSSTDTVLYGIEVLKPRGWVPMAGLFSRKVRQFSSMNDAMEASIAYWQRSGHAARPFKMTDAAA